MIHSGKETPPEINIPETTFVVSSIELQDMNTLLDVSDCVVS